MSKLYKKSGVDVVKTDNLIKNAINFIKTSHNQNVLGSKLGFSAEYKVNKDVTLCAATDGVGTKSILSAEFKNYKGIGQDLVAMCSNDILCNNGKPLFFLDYYSCGSVKGTQYLQILKSITEACKKINCALIGGETAEMPSLYDGNHFDLAGFLVALKKKTKKNKIKKGDLIIGIKSNGFHSNGYSLIRKIIKDNKIKPNKSFIGKEKLSSFLMRPTELYHRHLSAKDITQIKSMAHITGGGLIANFKRTLPPKTKFDLEIKKLPREYEFIKKYTKMTNDEISEVFNCGFGFTIVIDKKSSQQFLKRKNFKLLGSIK